MSSAGGAGLGKPCTQHSSCPRGQCNSGRRGWVGGSHKGRWEGGARLAGRVAAVAAPVHRVVVPNSGSGHGKTSLASPLSCSGLTLGPLMLPQAQLAPRPSSPCGSGGRGRDGDPAPASAPEPWQIL